MSHSQTLVIVVAVLFLFAVDKSFAIGYQGGKEAAQSMVTQQSQQSGQSYISSPKTYIGQFPVDYARVSADDVRKYYPYSERYLDFDVPEYFILREDYSFSRSNGEKVKIPAGFIWDGASIPEWLNKSGIIDKSNSRYKSAIREGLVHDYMYRNPHIFTKEEADELFCNNLEKYGNENPVKVCQGVKWFADIAYYDHKKKQKKGEYDVFTPEFYRRNKEIFQDGPSLDRPKLFDHDSQCKKENQSDEKVSHSEKNVCVVDKIPDLSKLIDLVKQSVEYLRRINAMGHKPSEDDYAGYNKLGAMARAEIKAIEGEIGRMNLTEGEKVELGNELGKQIREKVMPYCDELVSLRKQIEAKGYGHFEDSNFNFDPKYLK